jgi:protein O-mannosyl-transferase
MNYGLVLMAKGDLAGAGEYFQRAERLTPNYSYLHINIGILNAAQGKTREAARIETCWAV